jgi:hypothetical protein
VGELFKKNFGNQVGSNSASVAARLDDIMGLKWGHSLNEALLI